jgi:hypothetical protein
MNRFTILTALVLAGASTPAAAQSCQGYTPFSVAPMRVTGDLIFGDNVTQYGATFAGGQAKPGLFGGVSVAGLKADHADQTAKSLGVFGGFSVPVSPTYPGLEFCPVASFDHTWYPDVAGASVSGNQVTLGGALGRPFVMSPTLNLVPYVDLRWVHASVSIGDINSSDSFGQLGIGAGFVFSKKVTVNPVLLVPIAEQSASTAFGISLGFNFGK